MAKQLSLIGTAWRVCEAKLMAESFLKRSHAWANTTRGWRRGEGAVSALTSQHPARWVPPRSCAKPSRWESGAGSCHRGNGGGDPWSTASWLSRVVLLGRIGPYLGSDTLGAEDVAGLLQPWSSCSPSPTAFMHRVRGSYGGQYKISSSTSETRNDSRCCSLHAHRQGPGHIALCLSARVKRRSRSGGDARTRLRGPRRDA